MKHDRHDTPSRRIPGVDCVGFGIGALVVNNEEQIFVAKRGPKARNEVGKWEFPGGAVRFGEHLDHAVVREFLEEYGMRIELTQLLGVFDHILPEEGQHWVSATYIARHIDGIPVIREPEKCTAIGWYSIEAMPTPISEITRKNLIAYLELFNARGA